MTYILERIQAASTGRWGRRTLKIRMFSKVSISPTTDCWIWTASRDNQGYGQITVNGRPVKAHIVMWWLYRGQVPDGLTLDHLCRTVACVNPEHLEPTTRAENTRRQLAATGHPNTLKTHCRNGHRFTAANTRYASHGYGRVCRICRAESSRQYRMRQHALYA